jgi:hypothetical protein
MRQALSCWIFAALLSVNAHAETALTVSAGPDNPAPQQIKGIANVPPAPSDAPVAQNRVAAIVKANADASFEKISTDIANLSAKLDKRDYTPAIIGFLGVLIGGLITVWMQRRLLAHQETLANQTAHNAISLANLAAKEDRALASDRAKLEIGNSFVQWQLQQLSELYGPLHALFQQSQALYRHMNTVLANADPNKFRLRKDPETDRIDGVVFEILLDWRWERFRTILHVNKVYGQEYGVKDYFDGIAAIGGRIVKVIEEKAGYARPEQPELVSLFGKYLAHYAVLERLNAQCKRGLKPADENSDASPTSDIRVDESAVFPAEIQTMVATGFQDISNELIRWRAKASA